MDTIMSIVVIVFGILQIVLLLKIWGMTDDIRDIKNKYLSEKFSKNTDEQPCLIEEGLRIGAHVVEKKTGKQMKIIEIDSKNKIYICSSNSGFKNETFKEEEIELFDFYYKNLKG